MQHLAAEAASGGGARQKSDGTYPLLANDRSLSPAQVLAAHQGQPRIEKRFEQLKTVHEIAPVFLKNEARIEALFTLYFLALLVQARNSMRGMCGLARRYHRGYRNFLVGKKVCHAFG